MDVNVNADFEQEPQSLDYLALRMVSMELAIASASLGENLHSCISFFINSLWVGLRLKRGSILAIFPNTVLNQIRLSFCHAVADDNPSSNSTQCLTSES
ncbi:hypothetical protein PAXINDRAFT_103801 [Paxillus involutus ATCC 200175]|uniref:Uncharacterized protein n=1 Tax=Paxillus involutus ATCC 200175 TaxID=664439 RepID=A0A0C9TDN8_PAXIN|nr:hypothetical protein PAXINDRAFT_103801 [Paxillus involutus ATCC 200175]